MNARSCVRRLSPCAGLRTFGARWAWEWPPPLAGTCWWTAAAACPTRWQPPPPSLSSLPRCLCLVSRSQRPAVLPAVGPARPAEGWWWWVVGESGGLLVVGGRVPVGLAGLARSCGGSAGRGGSGGAGFREGGSREGKRSITQRIALHCRPPTPHAMPAGWRGHCRRRGTTKLCAPTGNCVQACPAARSWTAGCTAALGSRSGAPTSTLGYPRPRRRRH